MKWVDGFAGGRETVDSSVIHHTIIHAESFMKSILSMSGLAHTCMFVLLIGCDLILCFTLHFLSISSFCTSSRTSFELPLHLFGNTCRSSAFSHGVENETILLFRRKTSADSNASRSCLSCTSQEYHVVEYISCCAKGFSMVPKYICLMQQAESTTLR